MGCTIGQGLSGLSTLAVGSVLALAAIMAGAVLGLRWQTGGWNAALDRRTPASVTGPGVALPADVRQRPTTPTSSAASAACACVRRPYG